MARGKNVSRYILSFTRRFEGCQLLERWVEDTSDKQGLTGKGSWSSSDRTDETRGRSGMTYTGRVQWADKADEDRDPKDRDPRDTASQRWAEEEPTMRAKQANGHVNKEDMVSRRRSQSRQMRHPSQEGEDHLRVWWEVCVRREERGKARPRGDWQVRRAQSAGRPPCSAAITWRNKLGQPTLGKVW